MDDERSQDEERAVFRAPEKLKSRELRDLAERLYVRLTTALLDQGATMHEMIDDVLRTFFNQRLVVRKDDPQAIMDTLAQGANRTVGLDPALGSPYPNCIEWCPDDGASGLDVVFLEGQGNVGGLSVIVGFKPNERTTVRRLEGATRSLTGTNREFVRCVTGPIEPRDLRYLILRTPIDRFPVDQMTEAERETLEEWIEEGQPARKEFVTRALTFENFTPREPAEQIAAK